MSTIFANPGVIDPRCITTLGVNIKERDSPIGRFGTGLKYSIAVLLRNGQGVIIHAGARVYTFTTSQVTIRGKEFQLVCMNGQEMGFTTDLGRDWELWMAYRELWSNAIDEGGRVYSSDDLEDLEESTQIVVDGIEFDEVHARREDFLLIDRKAKYQGTSVEVYNGGSEWVFYRGIRAGKVPSGIKSRFTYNILEEMTLTEDRTLANSWEVQNEISEMLLHCTDKDLIIAVVTEDAEDVLEAKLDYDRTYTTASDEFISVVQRLKNSNSGKLNQGAMRKFMKQTHKEISPEGRAITSSEAATIQQARSFAESIGFPNSALEIRVADKLGDGTLAVAIPSEKVMVLSTQLVSGSWLHVAQAIIEESIHIRLGYRDLTRQLQTFLFEQIVRLGQEAQELKKETTL